MVSTRGDYSCDEAKSQSRWLAIHLSPIWHNIVDERTGKGARTQSS